jgi:hypothetical protein
MSKSHTHFVGVGDTLTPIGVTLKQGGTAVDVTGLTIKCKLVNADTDAVVTDWTTTGASIVSATAGTVQYDFAAADVASAGTFYLYFRVYSGAEFDTYPSDGRKLKIEVTNSA